MVRNKDGDKEVKKVMWEEIRSKFPGLLIAGNDRNPQINWEEMANLYCDNLRTKNAAEACVSLIMKLVTLGGVLSDKPVIGVWFIQPMVGEETGDFASWYSVNLSQEFSYGASPTICYFRKWSDAVRWRRIIWRRILVHYDHRRKCDVRLLLVKVIADR